VLVVTLVSPMVLRSALRRALGDATESRLETSMAAIRVRTVLEPAEYPAIFTFNRTGRSVAWQRACFGSRGAVSGEAMGFLSTAERAEKPPIIV